MNLPSELIGRRGDPPAQRRLIAEMQRIALNAADPREAVFRRVQRIGHVLTVAHRTIDLRAADRIFLVAIGKAAVPMADALIDLLGDDVTAGVLVTKRGHAADFQPAANLQVIEAGHPVPDEDSIAGARAIEHLLRDATGRDPSTSSGRGLVLCAVSGGGSALVTLPVEGVSLAELQTTTDLLLRSGATIHELNTIRKHLDRIKGGGLARMSRGANTLTLLFSDVIGDDVSVIASGPTAPDPSSFADAWQVIDRYDLAAKLPPSVKSHLESGLRGEVPDTPQPGDALFESVFNLIIGSNRLAAEAVEKFARSLGFNTLLLSTFVQGEAREVAKVAAAIAREIDASSRPVARPACIIWGGETTVTVRGSGTGGRNQELALAAALGIEGLRDTWIVALATDGSDGPTDAAGAMVTGDTIARAREAHIGAATYLAENDSYNFFVGLPGFQNLEGLIKTGPTGTNVNDLLFLIMF
ncbi:MAG: glycerate kinase type-2 family protein [Anaerolineae bacterium]